MPFMARLRDVPKILSIVGPWEFTKRVWREIGEDEVLVWAAALAYSWLFAIFPFFIFLLTLLPYLPQKWKVEVDGPVSAAIHRALPDQAADAVWQNMSGILHRLLHRPHTGLLSTGLLITIWAASGGMSTTMAALDRCYDIPRARSFWIQRPLAIALTIVVAVLILAVLILLPVATQFIHYARDHNMTFVGGISLAVWNALRYILALALLIVVLSLIHYFGPGVRQQFHLLSPGGVFTIGVWMLLAWCFRFYINRFGKYDQTYGTLGGVAILLLFFYLDAVVLLVGAEIDTEMDFALGVPRGSYDFRRAPMVEEEE